MEAVRVIEASMVVPSEKTPRTRLWVSNLDVALAARGYVPLLYLYRRPDGGASASASVDDDIGRLKVALAKALVPFYPLAGGLAVDGGGRPEIDCNAEGVPFVAARSGLTADGVRRLELSPEMKRLFVPAVDSGEAGPVVYAVQVTFLQCGGVVVGVAFHHVAGDAPSSFHILRTWAMLARTGLRAAAAVELPCHDRRLLRARSPPFVDHTILSVFSPKIKYLREAPPTAAKTLYLTGDQVKALRRLSGGGGGAALATTFRAVAAHVWRCACAARGLRPHERARLLFMASVRRHVAEPRLPEHYFGNTTVTLGVAAAAREIAAGPLAAIAGRIGVVVGRMSDGFVRSVVDYLELGEPGMGGVPPPGACLPPTELRVVSWLGMRTHDADFGWGPPELMARADLPMCGAVVLAPDDAGGGGGVRVGICLELDSMEPFEKLLYAIF